MADTNKKIRLIIKLMVISLIVAGIGFYMLKDKNVGPFKSNKGREYTEMYKYKDTNGVLHYTDIKPENTEYEVLYMPVSKDKPTIGKTVKGLIDKALDDPNKKTKQETPKTNISANGKLSETDEKASDQAELIKEAKETLQTITDYYKDAPEAINEAKKVREQVEKIYQEREKAMEEMR